MPSNRSPDNRTYQFEMDKHLHNEAKLKARINNFPLAALMRMHLQDFVDRPIEQSRKLVKRHLTKELATTAQTNGAKGRRK